MTTPVLDFEDICTALGARFTAAAMGTPTGAPAVRAVYPQSTRAVPSRMNSTLTANSSRAMY